jgi:hypothetical protein
MVAGQAAVQVLAVLQQQQVVLVHQDKATAAQMSKAVDQAVVAVVQLQLQHHRLKELDQIVITQVQMLNTQEAEAAQV